jgi:hypothetical protein
MNEYCPIDGAVSVGRHGAQARGVLQLGADAEGHIDEQKVSGHSFGSLSGAFWCRVCISQIHGIWRACGRESGAACALVDFDWHLFCASLLLPAGTVALPRWHEVSTGSGWKSPPVLAGS